MVVYFAESKGKRNYLMRSKKILAALCAAAVFALGGCSDTDFDDTEYDDSEVLTEKKRTTPKRLPRKISERNYPFRISAYPQLLTTAAD